MLCKKLILAFVIVLVLASAAAAQLDHLGSYVNFCLRHPRPLMPRHFCVIGADKNLYCWGENKYGELGDGGHVSNWQPRKVTNLSGVDLFALGEATTFAVARGSLYAWGRDREGDLGRPSQTADRLSAKRFLSVPQKTELNNVLSVSVGLANACAVVAGKTVAENSLYCWGTEEHIAKLGFADQNAACPELWIKTCDRPMKMAPTGMVAVALHANSLKGCLLMPNGEVHCWGYVLFTQEKPPDDIGRLRKIDIADAASFSLGENSLCVVTHSKKLFCWGYDVGGPIAEAKPERKDMGLSDVKQVSGDYHGGCAVTESGALYCWGDNRWSQLGLGKNWLKNPGCVVVDDSCKGRRIEACNAPLKVPLSDVSAVQVVGSSVVATTRDGRVYQWGATGSSKEVDTPTRLLFK